VKAILPQISERKICRVLGVARSSLPPQQGGDRSSKLVDELLAARVHRLVQEHPTFGNRRIWSFTSVSLARFLIRPQT
jgi:hypothetical protein